MTTAADEHYMRQALQLAARAAALGEVPVGAIVVFEQKIIARGSNETRKRRDPSAHAEILALREAARTLQSPRIPGTTLYVTLEPCVMCVGALVNARIDRLVYGAREPKTGAVISVFELLMSDRHNHRVAITEGVLGIECSAMLSDFFGRLRGGSE